MDLDDIRLFVKVAEQKSFVKAANELRIQTSLLSRRIARLEGTLGVRLLQRTTRRVSLTEEGSRFLAETTRGLDQLHSAVDSLNSLHGAPKGKVRVASPIELGQLIVETVMEGFFLKYPDIQIEWDFINYTKNIVESGTDLVLRPGRSQEQSLIEKKIGTITRSLFRSPKLNITVSKNPDLEELESLPWLVYTRGALDSQRVKFPLIVNGKLLEIRPKNVRFRTNSLVALRHAVVQGIGIGLLPPPISNPDVARGALVAIRQKTILCDKMDFYACYPSREYLSPKVRVLVDWLAEEFSKITF
jgi:DNA-binding transcriptional LysR family regulator